MAEINFLGILHHKWASMQLFQQMNPNDDFNPCDLLVLRPPNTLCMYLFGRKSLKAPQL